jgi:hypothetical protein
MGSRRLFARSSRWRSKVKEVKKNITSLAEMSGQPEQQSQSRAKKQARDDRKVERGVFAAVDDIAGKATEPKGKLSAEVKQCANDNEEPSEDEQ